jgi:hypothetical protein
VAEFEVPEKRGWRVRGDGGGRDGEADYSKEFGAKTAHIELATVWVEEVI